MSVMIAAGFAAVIVACLGLAALAIELAIRLLALLFRIALAPLALAGWILVALMRAMAKASDRSGSPRSRGTCGTWTGARRRGYLTCRGKGVSQ